MSIKQRLDAAEKRAGIGSDVDIIVFRTFTESKSGGSEFTSALAVLNTKNDCETLCSTNGETSEQFNIRVEAECLFKFGNLPHDWKTT